MFSFQYKWEFSFKRNHFKMMRMNQGRGEGKPLGNSSSLLYCVSPRSSSAVYQTPAFCLKEHSLLCIWGISLLLFPTAQHFILPIYKKYIQEEERCTFPAYIYCSLHFTVEYQMLLCLHPKRIQFGNLYSPPLMHSPKKYHHSPTHFPNPA